jgi:hypothetical protein
VRSAIIFGPAATRGQIAAGPRTAVHFSKDFDTMVLRREIIMKRHILLFVDHLRALLYTKTRADQEDNIREAVFRHQFKAFLPTPKNKLYFLLFGTQTDPQDPPVTFMERFQGHIPPVKPFSQCVTSRKEGVKDKNTGERGLIFSVKSITWGSAIEAIVEGGYYSHGRAASYNCYRVVYEGGKWVVKEDKMLYAS